MSTTITFISKLFAIIADPAYSSFIEWSEDGNIFIIKNSAQFSEHVLVPIFKHNNFVSFVRQLNLFDFHKINRSYHRRNTLTPEQRAAEPCHFYHNLFKRDMDLSDLEKIQKKMPNHAFHKVYPGSNDSQSQEREVRNDIVSNSGTRSTSPRKRQRSSNSISPQPNVEDFYNESQFDYGGEDLGQKFADMTHKIRILESTLQIALSRIDVLESAVEKGQSSKLINGSSNDKLAAAWRPFEI